MKEKDMFIKIGIVIYIILTGTDKFVVTIPNIVFIPFAILGIVLIFVGFIRGKRKDK